MEQKFDILGRYKYPKLKLCKPNREGQGYINGVLGLKIKRSFNFLHDLSFEINWLLDGKENPLYNKILGKKVIFADQYGYFTITDAKVEGSGISEKKIVTAVSSEVELAKNKLNKVEKTLKLYNPLNPNDISTLLGFFMQQNKNWKVGTVDSELWNLYRTFDVQTSDWYNFLIKDVEEKYMCIFVFDNVNRIVHCRTAEKATNLTNIFASYENLIDSISIEEKADEVFTALNCNGANYLDIRSVNPLGSNIIYNWDYFKTTDWISDTLIDKINIWEDKVKINQKPYKDLLTNLREIQSRLTIAETEFTEIESKIAAVEQAMVMASAAHDDNRWNELVNEKNQLQNKLNNQQNIINSEKNQLNSVMAQMKAINSLLSFENNFTNEEISQLDDITIVDNFQNDGFKKTDIMTPVEIQDKSQALYDYCIDVLKRVSSPKYYFSADMINFIFLKEYEVFTKQADIGSIITVEIKKGWRTKVMLLSISLDFDNPTSFSMEFSNRHRLDNGKFEFNDLFSDNSYSSSSYDWDKAIINEPVKSGQLTEVKNFINGNFDAAKNALETAKGIGIILDGSGLHGRSIISGVLSPFELWITNNMIAFSNDNFNSVPNVAIGNFKLPSGNIGGGVNAEFLAGRLIVGNQIVIESEDKGFKFDGNGAQFYNAIVEVVDKSNLKRTLIDPDNGFKIQGRINPNKPWEDKIFLDNQGNANLVGNITAIGGDIAGFLIEEHRLSSKNGRIVLNDNGTGKWGLLRIDFDSATFDGNIYARNLLASEKDGWINDYHLKENTIKGGKIKDDTIAGSKLMASYKDGVTNSIAKVEAKADQNSSSISIVSQTVTSQGTQIASISVQTNANTSSISMNAQSISMVAEDVRIHGNLIAEKVSTTTFDAETASIKNLVAEKVSTTTFDAETASIKNLVAKKVSTTTFDAETASIKNLVASKVSTNDLTSKVINIIGSSSMLAVYCKSLSINGMAVTRVSLRIPVSYNPKTGQFTFSNLTVWG